MSENFGGASVADMDFEALINHEWLSTNGIGGYASSTVPSMNTRRYHGLLVAAMAPLVRRMVLLSRVEENVLHDGASTPLACNEYPGTISPRGHEQLRAFSNQPFPRWAYQGPGWTIEKQLRLLRGENTVLLSYTLLGATKGVELDLRPLFALRGIHDLSYQWNGRLAAEQRWNGHHHVPATSRTPELFFAHDGSFERRSNWYLNTIYRRESERGYAGLEDVWSPGAVRYKLSPGKPSYFACSADPIELERVVERSREQFGPAARTGRLISLAPGGNDGQAAVAPASDSTLDALLRAADQFVIATPTGNAPPCAVDYPWHAPSPRTALAAFAGLYLVPGRFEEGRDLLLSLVPQLRDGLLPSEYPEDASAPVYGLADTSLWFVNAVHQYLAYTGDEESVSSSLLDAALSIIDHYRRGTALGIYVDVEGLLLTSAPDAPTTWMNARVGSWVVTPRRGRPVEVNALWYNAVSIAAALAQRFGRPSHAAMLPSLARSIRDAFNGRFWNDAAGCCYDVVDSIPGDEGRTPPDASVRPNQLLAIGLPFPVLAAERHASVIEKVRQELLTPFGPRTLSPRDANYQGHYRGDVASRDRAHHNGSVHPWLLGPFIAGFLRIHGRGEAAQAEARQLLEPCLNFVADEGLGQLGELFDGEAPHRPGGAIASALSIGELLRCYAEDILGRTPQAGTRPIATKASAPQAATSGREEEERHVGR